MITSRMAVLAMRQPAAIKEIRCREDDDSMQRLTTNPPQQIFNSILIPILLIAGAVLCAAGPIRAQELRAGYAKVDVTPTGPINLGGYDLREGPSDGIHGNDRLYARALIFEVSGVRLAFVEADVISTNGHDVFRRQISDATGIPFANILLGDAHNHSAPAPSAPPKTEWDREFSRGVVKAATQAVANLQPVRIAAGTGPRALA